MDKKQGILIVDDCKDSLILLKHWLTKSGFDHIMLANSADEALRVLQQKTNESHICSVDLILLDIVMPGRDGIEICSVIKEIPEYGDIPIIMVTSLSETSVLEKAFAAGAMDFVKKPFNKIELKARIQSALRLKLEMDQRKEREAQLVKVTEKLQRANHQLQELSMLDGLTGIPNRRRFDEVIQVEWERSYRSGTPLSVILLDIDKFKAYNDTYGHLEGDECLKLVARILQQSVKRSTDLVARYGGEEFVMVLPETHYDGAKTIAERARKDIEDAQIPHISSPIKDILTISAGAATVFPKTNICSLQKFIDFADKQLYAAKNNGRNQIKAVMIETSNVSRDE